jgi:magnesium transporter
MTNVVPDNHTPDSRAVSRWINHRELRRVRDYVTTLEPERIAECIEALELEEAIVLFRILPRNLAAEVFSCIGFEVQSRLLNVLGDSRIRLLLNEMAADDRTALFEELPAQATRALLGLLSAEERAIALSLLGYPESSVGRIMTPEYITVLPEWTVPEVLRHIRAVGASCDTLDVLYVISDQKGQLAGQVELFDLLTAPVETTVKTLTHDVVAALDASEDQEVAVRTFTKYGLNTVPVVDSNGTLVGVVTGDDILQIAAEEASEDIQRIGGASVLETPYLQASFGLLIKSRALWLVVLLVGEMLTASTMAMYENQLQSAVTLALFLPLIISSGGNSGSQAATIVIRSLSTGEITLLDWFKIFKRELAAGLVLGVLLALVGAVRVALWGFAFQAYGPQWPALSFTVLFSLVFVVLWGTVSGAMFPLVLQKLGADPATASAPVVATVVDVVGLIIYFTVASVLI